MEDNAKIDNANPDLAKQVNQLRKELTAEDMPVGEYVHNRSAIVMHRDNYSEYRKANMAFLSDGNSKIGSAIRSFERMKVNKAEMDVYMPMILGEHPTSPNYMKRVEDYFSNLSVIVTPGGKTLDISIRFNSYSDYSKFNKDYTNILNKFNKAIAAVGESDHDADKQVDDIYKTKDASIIDLESKLYSVGSPVNIGDYILWRYCLVYRDVANDEERVTKSENIRFYIYNKALKEQAERSKFEIQSAATLKYAELLTDIPTLELVLWGLSNVHPIDIKSLKKDDATGRAMQLDKIVKSDPQGFLSVANSKQLATRAFIEKAVSYGLINRIPNTQVLMDKEGGSIASTLQEAIVYFKNRELHGEFIGRIENQLKSL